MENQEKYLPIGTVVMLKGGKKRAMITGFCSIADDKKEKMYDYSGCMFPEGFLSSNQALLFDHEQIEKIYHLGLVDDDEKLFKARLKDFMEKGNLVQQETTEVKTASEEIVPNPSGINVFQSQPSTELKQEVVEEL